MKLKRLLFSAVVASSFSLPALLTATSACSKVEATGMYTVRVVPPSGKLGSATVKLQ
jgi:hypothetical protein